MPAWLGQLRLRAGSDCDGRAASANSFRARGGHTRGPGSRPARRAYVVVVDSEAARTLWSWPSMSPDDRVNPTACVDQFRAAHRLHALLLLLRPRCVVLTVPCMTAWARSGWTAPIEHSSRSSGYV